MSKPSGQQVPVKGTTGTVLIQENTRLPAGLSVKSKAFLPGWRVVAHLDAYELSQKIEDVKCNFFCLAEDIKVIAFGRDEPETLRKAIKSVLAKCQGRNFNSLQITEILPKRFLGIPYLGVTARPWHIQKSIYMATS